MANEQVQIIELNNTVDKLRKDLYMESLRTELLLKLLYQHRALPDHALLNNWQSWLWNEIGATNEHGMMKGFLKVSHYD